MRFDNHIITWSCDGASQLGIPKWVASIIGERAMGLKGAAAPLESFK